MTFVRGYLLAVGVFSLLAGLAYVIWPVEMAALAGITLTSTTAVMDVQGFYGGQLAGLGAAILLGAWKPRFVVPALFLAVVPLAGTALGRLYGVITAVTCPPLIAALLVVEVATAGVGAVMLKRELARPA